MINEYNTSFSFKNSKFPISKFLDLTLVQGNNSLKKYIDSKLISIDHENIEIKAEFLKLEVFGCSWKGNNVADVGHARYEQNQSFKASGSTI